jgi:ABC-type uncharacterized transport system permease subunit
MKSLAVTVAGALAGGGLACVVLSVFENMPWRDFPHFIGLSGFAGAVLAHLLARRMDAKNPPLNPPSDKGTPLSKP